MIQRRKGYKGTIIWDESASYDLVRPTIDAGFKVKSVSPVDRSQSDKYVAKKYAKGRYPVCTGDKSSYKEMYFAKGATAFIILEPVSKDDLESYIDVYKKFLEKHTSSTLKGKIWEVNLKGTKSKKLDR